MYPWRLAGTLLLPADPSKGWGGGVDAANSRACLIQLQNGGRVEMGFPIFSQEHRIPAAAHLRRRWHGLDAVCIINHVVSRILCLPVPVELPRLPRLPRLPWEFISTTSRNHPIDCPLAVMPLHSLSTIRHLASDGLTSDPGSCLGRSTDNPLCN